MAKSVEPQHNSRNAIEHVAIVRDEHQRAAILEQTFLQDFQRGNVEIVCRLVEKQYIRGLQHQLSDQDASAFSAGKPPNALIQRFTAEEETRRPRRNMNHLVLITHRIAVGSERAAQSNVGIELAILVEIDDAEIFRLAHGAARGFQFTLEQAKKRGFATAIRANEADAHAVGDDEVEMIEQLAIADGIAEVVESDELLGLAIRGGERDSGAGSTSASVHVGEFTDEFVGFVDARFGFGGARFGAAAQPLDLGVNAILQSFLTIPLGVEIQFFRLQERTVVAGNAQRSIFVSRIELDDFVGNILKEIAIVADDHAGERGVEQHAFEPLDAGEVQMIRGFVEEKNVGFAHQSFGDGEAFAPATGERSGFRIEIGERGASEDFGGALQAFAFGDSLLIESFVNYRANCVAGRELGNLADEIEMRAFADGHVASIGKRDAAEDVKESGLAGAIWTNDADAIALGNSERDILKQRNDAVAFGKSLGADDGWQEAASAPGRLTLPE